MSGVATMVAIGIAGCSCGGVDGPVLTSGSGDGSGDGALVQRNVVLDDGCLVLEFEGTRYPVVWPEGTDWQPSPPAVVLSDDTVPVGGTVAGGGGYYQAEHLGALPDEVVDAAVACAGSTGEIAVFNWGGDVTFTEG